MKTTSFDTVQTVLSLLDHNLSFRVQVTLDEAEAILRKFSVYNEIPHNLSDLVADLRRDIGPVAFGPLNGRPNPNDGGFSNIRLWIGNEGSLVIYVSANTFYRRGKGDTYLAYKSALESIGQRFKADEITVEEQTGAGPIAFARLWWD